MAAIPIADTLESNILINKVNAKRQFGAQKKKKNEPIKIQEHRFLLSHLLSHSNVHFIDWILNAFTPTCLVNIFICMDQLRPPRSPSLDFENFSHVYTLEMLMLFPSLHKWLEGPNKTNQYHRDAQAKLSPSGNEIQKKHNGEKKTMVTKRNYLFSIPVFRSLHLGAKFHFGR